MGIEFNNEHGLWWPSWENRKKEHFNYHTRKLSDTKKFLAECAGGLCFQAGGNVGIWPNYFSSYFSKVYTAEADPDLYKCLVKNARRENICCIEGAVSDSDGKSTFYRTGKSGTGTLNPKEELRGFEVSTFTIDSMDIEFNGLYLDIEGHEEMALRGAEATIKKSRPVICVETFDRTRKGINDFLKYLGYEFISRSGRDCLYLPK